MKKTKLNWFKILRFIFGTKKKPYIPTKLHIQKSVSANGVELDSNDLILTKNKLRGLQYGNKDRRACQYDYVKNSCMCGITIDKLKNDDNCPLK